MEDFQESLVGEDWMDFYDSRDPNPLWETMERIIRSTIDRVCPLKSYSVSEIREPWITNEAIETIRDKDRMMKKAKRWGSKKELGRGEEIEK